MISIFILLFQNVRRPVKYEFSPNRIRNRNTASPDARLQLGLAVLNVIDTRLPNCVHVQYRYLLDQNFDVEQTWT
jgi:hypothetical protein